MRITEAVTPEMETAGSEPAESSKPNLTTTKVNSNTHAAVLRNVFRGRAR